MGFIFTPKLDRVFLSGITTLDAITGESLPGEQFKQCFIRIVKEKTGLDIVRECDDIAVIEDPSYRTRVYAYGLKSGETIKPKDKEKIKSISIRKLHEYKLADNLELLIPYSRAHLSSKSETKTRIGSYLILRL